jgi:hypothetical protein
MRMSFLTTRANYGLTRIIRMVRYSVLNFLLASEHMDRYGPAVVVVGSLTVLVARYGSDY